MPNLDNLLTKVNDKVKLATFPSVDISGLDVSRLADTNEKLVAAVRDAAYVTVGFGVLAVQQAQVRRREMVRNIATRFGTSKAQVEQMLGKFETQFAKLDTRVVAMETKIDAAVEKFEDRLPHQAAAVVGQAHGLVKAARKQVRDLVGVAPATAATA
ncbi:MAG: hypothetical protein K8R99_15765 [Actinomycetia bacterium]|nr:hypothetical protein [Actinomycetes bacterium]